MILREPRCFPRDFEGDIEDGGVMVLRSYTGEVFRREAIMDVMAKMRGGEAVYFQVFYVIYCLM